MNTHRDIQEPKVRLRQRGQTEEVRVQLNSNDNPRVGHTVTCFKLS